MPTRRFDNLDPERRERLLDAAAQEFSVHGYTGAVIARILEASGFSKGSLYYYFEDKPDLYATVVKETVARWVGRLGAPNLVTDEASFWVEVERIVQTSMDTYLVDPWLPGLVRSLVADGGAVANLAPTRELLVAFTAGLVQLGQGVGAVRSDLPQSLLISVGTSLSHGIDLWVAEHWESLGSAEREGFVAQIVDIYRRAARPPE